MGEKQTQPQEKAPCIWDKYNNAIIINAIISSGKFYKLSLRHSNLSRKNNGEVCHAVKGKIHNEFLISLRLGSFSHTSLFIWFAFKSYQPPNSNVWTLQVWTYSWHTPTKVKTLGTTDFRLANLGSAGEANFPIIIRISNSTPSKTAWTNKGPIKIGSAKRKYTASQAPSRANVWNSQNVPRLTPIPIPNPPPPSYFSCHLKLFPFNLMPQSIC